MTCQCNHKTSMSFTTASYQGTHELLPDKQLENNCLTKCICIVTASYFPCVCVGGANLKSLKM